MQAVGWCCRLGGFSCSRGAPRPAELLAEPPGRPPARPPARSYARVQRDLRKAKVVAGALQQGDDDEGGEEAAAQQDAGNAGTWINLDIMMEEVGG